MLNLTEDALHLQCRATHKNEAIHIAASALEKAGYVKPGFEQAMLSREKSVSTYIGAGIALPHCAKENPDLVIQSGFQVFQFPDGVSWGKGKIVFIVVAVAATKNEHIQILADIADLLGDEVKTTLLANARTKSGFIDQFERA
ncbi:PTS sugar transporter subunit IIA [Pantoea sp. Bo_7]|uniref:PTS sugar transporter subunit IIA n=1 Tax=unclassified Pantoea TaxID=2630326 RepID=UPI0012329BE5|nr:MULTISPECIES: PTS sugar transporter subunit IIA [unclassified Pantoea]KAA6044457.1 PTS sugar transporter subunit IIA [Pantoea sp. Bo_7]KAA6090234.1 PTS sugar transporter subunit IIA [Pantoea sp. Bo_10]